jgi:integrase
MLNVNLTLDTRRPKKSNKFPLKIRIHFKLKTFYFPLDIDLFKEEWNEKLTLVTEVHPSHRKLQLVVRRRLLDIEELLLTISQEQLSELTGNQLKALISKKDKPCTTLSKYTRDLISNLEKMNRPGSALAYKQAIHSLEKFGKSKSLEFSDINFSFLKKYEEQLIIEGKRLNTVSAYLRQIRAVFNRARNEELISHSNYPFTKYKIRTEKTVQRGLKEDEIRRLWHCEVLLNKEQEFALDMFRLTFCLIGINYSDLACLTTENIVEGRIVYKRSKTKKLYSIKINAQAEDVLNKHAGRHSKYLLPILPEARLASLKQKNVLKQKLKMTNKHLKNIGSRLGFEIGITTYVARYSWANIAKRYKYSNELIAEGLGHSYGNRTTNIYLDSFDKVEVDKMNEFIVGRIVSPCDKDAK